MKSTLLALEEVFGVDSSIHTNDSPFPSPAPSKKATNQQSQQSLLDLFDDDSSIPQKPSFSQDYKQKSQEKQTNEEQISNNGSDSDDDERLFLDSMENHFIGAVHNYNSHQTEPESNASNLEDSQMQNSEIPDDLETLIKSTVTTMGNACINDILDKTSILDKKIASYASKMDEFLDFWTHKLHDAMIVTKSIVLRESKENIRTSAALATPRSQPVEFFQKLQEFLNLFRDIAEKLHLFQIKERDRLKNSASMNRESQELNSLSNSSVFQKMCNPSSVTDPQQQATILLGGNSSNSLSMTKSQQTPGNYEEDLKKTIKDQAFQLEKSNHLLSKVLQQQEKLAKSQIFSKDEENDNSPSNVKIKTLLLHLTEAWNTIRQLSTQKQTLIDLLQKSQSEKAEIKLVQEAMASNSMLSDKFSVLCEKSGKMKAVIQNFQNTLKTFDHLFLCLEKEKGDLEGEFKTARKQLNSSENVRSSLEKETIGLLQRLLEMTQKISNLEAANHKFVKRESRNKALLRKLFDFLEEHDSVNGFFKSKEKKQENSENPKDPEKMRNKFDFSDVTRGFQAMKKTIFDQENEITALKEQIHNMSGTMISNVSIPSIHAEIQTESHYFEKIHKNQPSLQKYPDSENEKNYDASSSNSNSSENNEKSTEKNSKISDKNEKNSKISDKNEKTSRISEKNSKNSEKSEKIVEKNEATQPQVSVYKGNPNESLNALEIISNLEKTYMAKYSNIEEEKKILEKQVELTKLQISDLKINNEIQKEQIIIQIEMLKKFEKTAMWALSKKKHEKNDPENDNDLVLFDNEDENKKIEPEKSAQIDDYSSLSISDISHYSKISDLSSDNNKDPEPEKEDKTETIHENETSFSMDKIEFLQKLESELRNYLEELFIAIKDNNDAFERMLNGFKTCSQVIESTKNKKISQK